MNHKSSGNRQNAHKTLFEQIKKVLQFSQIIHKSGTLEIP